VNTGVGGKTILLDPSNKKRAGVFDAFDREQFKEDIDLDELNQLLRMSDPNDFDKFIGKDL